MRQSSPGAVALSRYIFASKYSHTKPDGSRENYDESVTRIMNMHRVQYAKKLDGSDLLAELVDKAEGALRRMEIVGSMRNAQYGGTPVLKNNLRSYNCCASFCDRPRFFAEAFYLLLCGCGTGFSVQKHHVKKLPLVKGPIEASEGEPVAHVVEDSIEGWADAAHALVMSYFEGTAKVVFDYSEVRPKGSRISSISGLAPGPEPLEKALEAVRECLNRRWGGRLRPIDAYDIVMHLSCAVLSGGVRRSATIAIFSPDDEDMLTAKSGNWFETNPQRARSNNSALLLRNSTDYETFRKLVETARVSGGEPGFYWADSTEIIPNPCVEVGFYPVDQFGNSGWHFCNLASINGTTVESFSDFLERCEAAAVLATLQAGYTSFPYLGEVSERIARNESLIGISITGIQDNPTLLLDPVVLTQGVAHIRSMNEMVARLIGIAPAARLTAIKPEGTTSSLLDTASGKHRRHAKRYIRRVQANGNEVMAQVYAALNPLAVEESVWNQGDLVLKFPIESPEGARVRGNETALDQLAEVVLLKRAWIDPGRINERCAHPAVQNNVSNTVTVKNSEWESVAHFIYLHREAFAGVSLLPASGDLDYPQAPYVSVDEPEREAERREWESLAENLIEVDYSATGGIDSFAESVACAGGSCEVI